MLNNEFKGLASQCCSVDTESSRNSNKLIEILKTKNKKLESNLIANV